MQKNQNSFDRFMLIAGMVTLGFTGMPLRADIVTVSGPLSSAGVAPAIVPAPPDLTNQCVLNQSQQGFNEKQQVTTSSDFATDTGTIPKGTTLVNSHMIFLNQPDTATGTLSHNGVTWTFDFPIVGVMSDGGGFREAASTKDFGAPATNYTNFPTTCGTSAATGDSVAPFPSRGLEPATDSYSVSGNTLTMNMSVAQPGDWVRVLTRGLAVQIDIKPGGYPNCFNINGNGVVPVAILGSTSLNVSNVNTASLSFNGLAVRVKPNNQNQCSLQDVNGDGVLDLVCQFQDNVSNWQQGSSIGIVTGTLNDGTSIRGTDSICVVP